MANVTTYQFFNGLISIPNNNPSKPQGELLQDLIVEYERKYLVDFFGQLQAVEIMLEITTPDSMNLPYYDIVNGATYVDANGDTMRWDGFKYDADNLYSSPIANYIYWQYQKNNATLTTGIGEFKQESQNSTIADASHKVARAWNDMVAMNKNLHNYLLSIKGTYSTFDNEYIGFKYPPDAYYANGYIMPNQQLFIPQNIYSL